MQGQRSTMELDQGSSSSNSSIDPLICWGNMLNPMDTRDIADFLLPPDDNMMPFTDGVNPESESLNAWNFNTPESSRSASNRSNLEETKRHHEWASATLSSSDTSPILHEGRCDAGNTLSLDNVAANIGNDPMTTQQEYNPLQNTADTAEIINSNGQLSAPCHSFNYCGHDSRQAKCCLRTANSCSASLPEDADGRPRNPMDRRCGSGKRKMIEGACGQSSNDSQGENSQQTISLGNNSLNSGLSISNSYNNKSIGTVQGINPSSGPVSGIGLSGSLPSAGAAGFLDNTHRNVRRRDNSSLERDLFQANLWPPENPTRHANIQSPHQPSVVVHSDQLPEVVPPVSASVSQSHSSTPAIPSLQNSDPFTLNGTTNSRADGSSSSHILSRERFPSRRVVRSIPLPVSDVRRLAQDPTNWNLSTRSISPVGNIASTSRAGSNSNSNPSVPVNWAANQIPHLQHPLRSDYSQLLPSIVSNSGVQSSSIRVQDPSHSTSPQDIASNTGSRLRSQQRHLLRSTLLIDRQIDGLPGVRMSAFREGRNRVITEQIRSALDALRRGLPYEFVRADNLRFESLMFGGVDLHDRHRDMRLDVDNMSYEELLALEERIGNVCTGLTEETVMKHLKQWKYTASSDESSEECEPCCICQEEYAENDDLGALHCGHNFHSQCIKKWLSYKNLCPVCKTALNT